MIFFKKKLDIKSIIVYIFIMRGILSGAFIGCLIPGNCLMNEGVPKEAVGIAED